MEGGTLVQLRNIINRKNVGSSKEVKHQVNEVEDFLEVVIKGHLIAAALHHFGMSDITDVPHCNAFPTNIDPIQFEKLFHGEMRKIINLYVVPRHFSQTVLTDVSSPTNPHELQILSEHDYVSSYSAPSVRSFPETLRQYSSRTHATQSVKNVAPDGVYNYASAVLNDGLLLLEFKDAIREGDGIRILRVWKVLSLYFHYAKHKKYLQESFQLASMVNATAIPRISSQLT